MNSSRLHGISPATATGEKQDCPQSPGSTVARGEGTSCQGFVNDLARLAERAKESIPADEARRRLAVELVYRYVPRSTILGLRVRRWIAGPDPEADRPADSCDRWGADGFRRSLIRGGQDEEVVRHVAAAAACVLARRVYLVRIASVYDWVQGLFRGRAEAKAEVAGNVAGIRVGRVLREYLTGRLDVSRLKAVLGAILCA